MTELDFIGHEELKHRTQLFGWGQILPASATSHHGWATFIKFVRSTMEAAKGKLSYRCSGTAIVEHGDPHVEVVHDLAASTPTLKKVYP